MAAFLKSLETSPVFSGVDFRSVEQKEVEENRDNIVEYQLVGRVY